MGLFGFYYLLFNLNVLGLFLAPLTILLQINFPLNFFLVFAGPIINTLA